MRKARRLAVLSVVPLAVMAQAASGGFVTGSDRAHYTVQGPHVDPRALATSPSLTR